MPSLAAAPMSEVGLAGLLRGAMALQIIVLQLGKHVRIFQAADEEAEPSLCHVCTDPEKLERIVAPGQELFQPGSATCSA